MTDAETASHALAAVTTSGPESRQLILALVP